MNVWVALVLALSGPEYPKQTGLVNDFAGILSPDARTRLEANLSGLQKGKNFVLVLVTVNSLESQSIEQYTVGLANAWAIGQKGKNNGIVFLIAPKEKAVRIENGYGAEGTLTDIESKFIMEEKVIPLFKDGKLTEGVVAGTDALLAKLGGQADAARAPPEQVAVPSKPPGTGVVVLIVLGVIVVCILMCFPAGRDILLIILEIALSGGKGGGSSKSGSSGGGKFGGGGASSKW